MFGSLRLPTRPGDGEARALYRAHFCASCHAMREVVGRSTSLLTNYDQTLLALVLGGLLPPCATQQRPCTALPWRSVAVAPLPPAVRAFLAAGNLALVDCKLRDDVDDGGGWLPRIARLALRRKVAAAHRRLGALGVPVALLERLPARQSAMEAARPASLPDLAQPSAELLAQIFAHGGALAGRSDCAAGLLRFGEAVGRAAYLFDALDDWAADRRRGRFNAVAALAEAMPLTDALAAARTQLRLAIAAAARTAAALLPPDRAAMVASILGALELRGANAEVRIGQAAAPRGQPRRREAGDCDCPCDAHGCHDPGCGADTTTCPYDSCCWWQGRTRDKVVRTDGKPSPWNVKGATAAERTLAPLVGRHGTARTAIGTDGLIDLDGVQFAAFTTGAVIAAGSAVTVIGVDGQRLRVAARGEAAGS